jgi:NTP pyrophosphatase (non-canonical NTP hydrolase)
MSAFAELQGLLGSFYDVRDWRRFQTPKDVAASLAIEAAELQEVFLWLDRASQDRALAERRHDVTAELADIIINCLNLAYLGDIDLEEAVRAKLVSLSEKYPAEEVRGRIVPHT